MCGTTELIKDIEGVFNGINRSEVSLQQFKLFDEKGLTGEITDEEWSLANYNRVDDEWQDISESEIKACGCLLAHMQAEDWIYYLPAYMRYAVRNYKEPVWEDDIIGSTVFALHPSGSGFTYNVAQLSLINNEQKKVIIKFLKFVEENANYVQRPDARKARKRYWENEKYW